MAPIIRAVRAKKAPNLGLQRGFSLSGTLQERLFTGSRVLNEVVLVGSFSEVHMQDATAGGSRRRSGICYRMDGGPRMRLPNTAHTSRPWRIHEIARDFRLEDVWALPTPGGPDDFPRLVRQIAAGDPVEGRRAARLGPPGRRPRLQGADAPRPVAGVPARRPIRPGLRPVHLALPARRRVRRGDGQPDRPRGHAPRLGPGRGGRLPGADGGPAQAERSTWDCIHGCDQAVPVRDRLPGADATDRAGVAGGCRLSCRRSRQDWRFRRTATITYQGGTHEDNKR